MKKSIAIITLYGEKNFGNKLQNYATQVFFTEMGLNCKTIKYCRRNIFYDKILKVKYEIFSRLGLRPKIPYSQRKREKNFRNFTRRYINMGETVNYNKIPLNLKKKYNYFVTGSDQVWHNYSETEAEINYFMLSFAKPEQRLTISPSFGIKIDEVSNKFFLNYKKGLDGFKKLSCREEEAAVIIKRISGRDALVTLDPTMLISKVYWNNMLKQPSNAISKKFLLLYFLGGISEEIKSYLNNMVQIYGLQVVDLYDINNVDLYTTSPDEFLWWIKNAALVATDSFHSTVFSIIFKIPFITYSRVNGEGMEDRIDTLLEKFGLLERKNIMNNLAEVFQVDFGQVDKTLEDEVRLVKDFYSSIIEKD